MSSTHIPEAWNPTINVVNTQAERAREGVRYAVGETADFVYRVAGGGDYRVPCQVLGVSSGLHGVVYRVLLSRDVMGYGQKREVTVAADRLARPRGKR